MSGSGRDYWRTLEELAETPEFAAIVENEVPRFRDVLGAFDRRRFLQLMAASMALGGLSACGPEANPRQLLPYVEQPPGIVPGRARYYATATTCDGYATGVLIAHQMARPIKVEGNPDHPASLGAASAIMQATILTLYDPRRAQSIVGNGQLDTWERFVTVLFERRGRLTGNGGEGLRLLTGNVTSPSLATQIAALQKQFPAMRWHRWEPLHRDAEFAAAQRAFGRPVERVFGIGSADVIFAVESDLISAVPGWLAYARQFAAHRRPDETGGKMSRVYAIESTPTLIGAKADHRLPLRPADISASVRYIAGKVGAGPKEWGQAQIKDAAWLDAAAQDMMQHRGRALIHVGREQPTEIHLLADAINASVGAFGATVRLIEPVAVSSTSQRQSLAELVADMAAGKVETLLMLDANPVYTAPADLDFAAALKRVPLSVSLSLYADETAQASSWVIPAAHEYEAWGDARAFDGTITIQQPQVRRLYGGHSAQELLAVLQGDTSPDDYSLVRGYWQQEAENKGRGDFEEFWREALRSGVVPDTASPSVTVTPRADVAKDLQPPSSPEEPALNLLFRSDPLVWDGRFADNAWLLEMARPFTRLTWDNAALIAPATAARLGIEAEDVLTIGGNGHSVRAPFFVLPGQAPDCITLPLGFGRRAGGLGTDVGFNAYQLRSGDSPWLTQGALSKTGDRFRLATTQGHDRVAGRDLIHEGTLAEYQQNPSFLEQKRDDKSLYPPYSYPRYAWAMAIDLNSCIGCQACAVACQAENNVPVVGKDQVLDQRVMHWLRIDRYYSGSPDDPRIAFEPMPCMHCENAPCEVVCPVHATVHDHDGLNLMVYNRCVGTRFCSNNCPYKVRRFNFFAYAINEERRPESWNPEVTVRGRGVMEKCTYCIQRIRTAQIEADKQDRLVRDDEVITACQQSCPTQAITFGNRNDPSSAVARRKASSLDYVLLEELNTRPRTSYTAMIRNPNSAIKSEKILKLVDLPSEAPVVEPSVTLRSLSLEVSERVLRPKAPRWWWIGFAFGLTLLLVLVVQLAWLFINGIGSWGVNIPVAWGLAIAEYVWWIALASGGTIVSALFYLTRSPWRSATNRIAETMLLSAAPCAGLMPIMHLGRPGLFYWLFPYSSVMGVWPQARSPLWWDFVCLLCYILMSIMYYYAGLIPDLATVRDVAQHRLQQLFYGVLALGWRGAARHWRNHQSVYAIMSAIMAPMVISVHSVVGLDFAGGLTPGWHDTQFPPYFFFGAVISGTALIIMLTILVRWGYGLQDVLTAYHLNAMAKLMLVGSLLLTYSYVWEAFGPFYGSDIAEKTEFLDRMFGFTAPAFWAEKALNSIIPQLLWFPAVRRSQLLLFLISGGVIVGMWLERYMFTISGLHRDYIPSYWGDYYPTLWDWAALAGTIGLFLTVFFVLLRFVPIVSMSEVREIIATREPP